MLEGIRDCPAPPSDPAGVPAGRRQLRLCLALCNELGIDSTTSLTFVIAPEDAGAAAAVLQRLGAQLRSMAPVRTAIVARWRASPSARGADRAWREGRGMGFGRAVANALGDDAPLPIVPSTREHITATLTRRQLEVARLVAEGLTNREIASSLFISERTAEGHIDQIFNKLGFNSRVQIAAWLIRQEQPWAVRDAELAAGEVSRGDMRDITVAPKFQ